MHRTWLSMVLALLLLSASATLQAQGGAVCGETESGCLAPVPPSVLESWTVASALPLEILDVRSDASEGHATEFASIVEAPLSLATNWPGETLMTMGAGFLGLLLLRRRVMHR